MKLPFRVSKFKTVLVEHFPQVLLYVIGFAWFAYSSIDILIDYFSYQTVAHVTFGSEEEKVQYPAFTICGPLVVDPPNSTVEHVLNHQSEDYKISQRIQGCEILEFSTPNIPVSKHPCGKPLSVIQNGRHCYTYFSLLGNTTNSGLVFTKNSMVLVQILLPDSQKREVSALVQFALHSPRHLPNRLEVQYAEIRSGIVFEVTFARVVQKFLENWSSCSDYDLNSNNCRSRSECMHYCNIQEAHSLNGYCLSWHSLVTLPLVKRLNLSETHFCPSANPIYAYLHFSVRELCLVRCPPQCHDTIYTMKVYERTEGQSRWDVINYIKHGSTYSNYSIVMLQPMVEDSTSVIHEPAINPFEMIGYLSGNADLFLGHSMIKTFDVALQVMDFGIRLFR